MIVVKVDPDIADLVPGFLANRAREVEALRAALAGPDLAALARIGHTLKGVGGGYGFPAISEIGERIEEAAGAGQTGLVRQAVAELADYLARVRVEVA